MRNFVNMHLMHEFIFLSVFIHILTMHISGYIIQLISLFFYSYNENIIISISLYSYIVIFIYYDFNLFFNTLKINKKILIDFHFYYMQISEIYTGIYY